MTDILAHSSSNPLCPCTPSNASAKRFCSLSLSFFAPFHFRHLSTFLRFSASLFALAFLIYSVKNDKSGSSDELIVQLTNNLSNEIQNIRKEVGENSEKNRIEIENKLLSINKEINDFHKTSKENIQKEVAYFYGKHNKSYEQNNNC